MNKNCIHHWMIDSQDIGTCLKCGKVRNFRKLQPPGFPGIPRNPLGPRVKLKKKRKLEVATP